MSPLVPAKGIEIPKEEGLMVDVFILEELEEMEGARTLVLETDGWEQGKVTGISALTLVDGVDCKTDIILKSNRDSESEGVREIY